MVTTNTLGGQRVSICTCTRMGSHLAMFTRRPGSSLYTLAAEPPQVAASAQVFASRQVPPPYSCRLLSHQTLLWHHRLGHPSLPRLRGMHSRLLVSGLPRSLPPPPPSPALPCLPCVEGRQRAAPHSSSFPPMTAPLQTLHMDVWGPARVSGQGRERYFLLVVDDYTHYTTVFPLRSKGEVPDVAIPWIRAVRLHLHERFGQDFPVLRLHFDTCGECITQSFMLPASPQKNGIAERRIGLVMEVARTSIIHAAAPYFLWPFAVRYAAHEFNLWPRVSLPETSPTLRWTGKVGDASVFRGPAPSSVSQGDPPPGAVPDEESVDSGAARGTASGGAEPGGVEPGGSKTGGAETGGAEPGGAEPAGLGGAESEGAESGGGEPQGAASFGGAGTAGARGAGVPAGAGVTGGTAATGPRGARTQGTGAAGNGGVGGSGVGGTGAGGAGAGRAGAVDPSGAVRPQPYFVPLLQQVLGVMSSVGLTPRLLCQPPEESGGLTERREPASRPVLPFCTARRVPRSRPPPVPGTHAMALRPSSIPLRVPLSAPPESSLLEVPDSESDQARAASPGVSHLLATAVTDPSFQSALVSELLNFAAACPLDYATALVAEFASASPPSVGGECALSTDVLEARHEDFECLAAAVPRFASMLLAPEGDPDAPDIPTPRSYAEAITSPYSSQWQAAMNAEMASWKSAGTYVDEVPPHGANIGVDYFQTFSPTPKMTTLRVLLHVAAQRDYELKSLDFSTTFLHGRLHEEIWLRRPPGFTGSFPAGTQWSLRRPVCGLRQAPCEWNNTLRTTLAPVGFASSTADPLLFLRTDTSLPPFYVLVYVNDLVFATADTEALTLVLQRFGFQFSSPQPTPLSTSHSLSASPSDESVELSGPYSELVGCLMYLMTCTRPDLAYPLSLVARYVAPSRHQTVHWDAAKRVLRYLCSTLGMGLVLGGRGPFVLTGHANASWVDDSATQRSSQGYTFSLGSGSFSWRSTHSSSVLSSSCEAEIYAGAMVAQELRWLTYLLTDLGEQPRSPPVVYVDNMAMIAFLKEH
ncbi:unnamed protein product [Closterium sp. NIES-54]